MNKKTTLLCSVLILFAVRTFAQSYAFYQGNTLLEDNAEITVLNFSDESDLSGTLSLESGLRLKNLTGNTVSASVSQTIMVYPLEETDATLSMCCFGTCTTRNIDFTKQGGVLAPNSFDETFHINFYVYEGFYASAKVKYEVFSPTDLSRTDKKTVTITYVYDANSAVTGLSNIKTKNKIIAFQEGNKVTFNYAPDANLTQLEVYGISGQKIAQYSLTLSKGTFTLPENLTNGLYVCTFKSEKGIVTTQKLIVR